MLSRGTRSRIYANISLVRLFILLCLYYSVILIIRAFIKTPVVESKMYIYYDIGQNTYLGLLKYILFLCLPGSFGCSHRSSMLPGDNWIIDIKNWIIDIKNWIIDIKNWIIDINNCFSIFDIKNWIIDIKNWIIDIKKWIIDIKKSISDINNSILDIEIYGF